MKFLSVCSGIEAASVAWEPLGWKAVGFSEIEPFPCAVLAHHYPDVPNYGDMTTLPARILRGEIATPDALCGGTPCQAFSVAGLRKSLDDARGNLSLVFCEIANAIDDVRILDGFEPAIIIWENVPGVLNTKDNAFGCFLAGLAGEDDPLVPAGGKWPNAGCVFGPQRTVAWRVLDAQYFGVAQRRRRVFVVASARNGFDPAAILFEFDGVRRDSAPSREAGKDAATDVGSGAAFGGGRTTGSLDVAACLVAKGQKCDFEVETFVASFQQSSMKGRGTVGYDDSGVAKPVKTQMDGQMIVTHSLRGEGFDASEDGTGRGTPLVPVAMRESGHGYWMQDDIAGALRAEGEDRPSRPSLVVGVPCIAFNWNAQPDQMRFDEHASATLTRSQGPAVAFSCKDYGADASAEHLAPALGATNPTAIAFAQNSRDEVRLMGGDGGIVGALAAEPGMKQTCYVALQDVRAMNKAQNGRGWNDDGTAYTVDTHAAQGVAVQASQSGVRFNETVGTLDANYGSRRHNGVVQAMQVRRLTPRDHEIIGGNYADAPQGGPVETLRALRQAIGEEAFASWCAGVIVSFHPQEVLRQALHGAGVRLPAWSRNWLVDCTLAFSESRSARAVQSVRESCSEGRPSQGWEPSEQLSRELGAYLSELSYAGASTQGIVFCLRKAGEGSRLLQLALSAVEELGQSDGDQGESARSAMQVRRLTPTECEFLQGFPRNYTLVPHRGKRAADGPRYKALGNSWAVPNVRWIGRRIDLHLLGLL